MFLEISQNFQENTCARVSFLIKLPVTLSKKRFWHRCFPGNLAKFLRTLFLQNTSGSCFCNKKTPPRSLFSVKNILLLSQVKSILRFIFCLFCKTFPEGNLSQTGFFQLMFVVITAVSQQFLVSLLYKCISEDLVLKCSQKKLTPKIMQETFNKKYMHYTKTLITNLTP